MKKSFRASSYIIRLLGDQLIGNDSLAVYELVKNSYDADAQLVTIYFDKLNTPEASIIIEDDGCGMSAKELGDYWLEIGTPSKRKKTKISNKYKRTTLGEKGIGRLAAFKLGNRINIITSSSDDEKLSELEIDIKALLENATYVEDMTVQIKNVYHNSSKKKHGTKITISDLINPNWTKHQLLELWTKVNSIVNPLQNVDNFTVKLKFDNSSDGLQNELTDVKSVLNEAVFRFSFELKISNDNPNDNCDFIWNYEFQPPSWFNNVKPKKNSNYLHEHLLLSNKLNPHLEENSDTLLRSRHLANLGNIKGEFYAFLLSSNIFVSPSVKRNVKLFLKNNAGIRIYKDSIRVFNYGEPSDDWLGLDIERVQSPGGRFSKNMIYGYVALNGEESNTGLIEKTNREGFDENKTYTMFRSIIKSVFKYFETTALADRQNLNKGDHLVASNSKIFEKDLKRVISSLKKQGIDEKTIKQIESLQHEYIELKNILVSSGITGLGLSIFFHEIKRDIRNLNYFLKDKDFAIHESEIKRKMSELFHSFENYTPFLSQNNFQETLPDIIRLTLNRFESRFIYHDVLIEHNLDHLDDNEFQAKFPQNLLLNVFANIIDNSLYWLSIEKKKKNNHVASIKISLEKFDESELVISIIDNGGGISIEQEIATKPFVTKKPDGMGMGLFYVNSAIEMFNGKLLIATNQPYNPKSRGTIVKIILPTNKGSNVYSQYNIFNNR